MASQAEYAIGYWWRFSSYVLDDGNIRPAPDASLEQFDPWTQHYEARADGFSSVSPYEDLVELVENLRVHPGPDGGLSVEGEDRDRLLAWCTRFGLLGVLPQQATSITLAARWKPPLGTNESNLLWPTTRRFFRTNLGWMANDSQVLKGDPSSYHLVDEPEEQGELVPLDNYSSNMATASVVMQDLRSAKVEEEKLTPHYSRYFPDVVQDEWETFDYPIPLSEKFWHLYAEPLDRFLAAAYVLRDALEGLRRFKALSDSNREDSIEAVRGRNFLHALTMGVSPAVVFHDDGRMEQRWVCKSLLATFAMMAMDDLTSGNRIDRCLVCQRFFTSSSPRATYCSVRCRQTAQKRAQRQRKKGRQNGQES